MNFIYTEQLSNSLRIKIITMLCKEKLNEKEKRNGKRALSLMRVLFMLFLLQTKWTIKLLQLAKSYLKYFPTIHKKHSKCLFIKRIQILDKLRI